MTAGDHDPGAIPGRAGHGSYVEYLGDHQIVHTLVESLGPLAVRAQPGEEWRSGDRGRIQVTAQVHVIAEGCPLRPIGRSKTRFG